MFNKKDTVLKNAFTLLELLVVIGIIAVLVAIGSVSYSTSQKKARDAKRRGDLHAAQNFMEQCYSVNGYKYPILSITSGRLQSTCPIGGATLDITDPKNSTPNIYVFTEDAGELDEYSITAQLETDTANPFIVTQRQ